MEQKQPRTINEAGQNVDKAMAEFKAAFCIAFESSLLYRLILKIINRNNKTNIKWQMKPKRLRPVRKELKRQA